MKDRSTVHTLFDIEETPVDDATAFLGRKTAHLYLWWRHVGGDGAPPKRSFDITEHRSIVPNVFLVETAAPGSFRFKLNGEETIEMLGENPAGHLVREYSISHYGYDLEEYYQSVAASRRCWKCFGRLMAAGKEHYLFESIDCPLAAEDGSISHIIGVMEIVDRLDRPFPRWT